jgi:adenine deaminase
VVDDRSCVDLLRDGDIDAVVRKAIRLGLEPVRAILMATINAAEHFRLERLGAVAPGYLANILVISDLSDLRIESVYYHGRLVASEGKPLFSAGRRGRRGLKDTVRIKPLSTGVLKLVGSGDTAYVIEIVPGQIITRKRLEKVTVWDGSVVPDVERDILKLVVVERHRATGNVGVGLVTGFGLKHGALASSIAHDSHNIVAVGTSDEDILAAVREIERLQGGLVVADDGGIVASLALPVAGLLSDEPLETVVASLENVEKAAAGLGTGLASPFATLSFVALPVIPELRLTDLGLVDVNEFGLIG